MVRCVRHRWHTCLVQGWTESCLLLQQFTLIWFLKRVYDLLPLSHKELNLL